jgi:hypothetical protein
VRTLHPDRGDRERVAEALGVPVDELVEEAYRRRWW